VDEPGNDFLAYPTFASYENLRVASRRIRDFFVKRPHGRRLAEQRIKFHIRTRNIRLDSLDLGMSSKTPTKDAISNYLKELQPSHIDTGM
jgi:hypothetical protein